ncbi:MAG: SDR family oxidoreductase [Rhodospirillaceae bacterium]|nr:SDR family oxidoreductase [Rhodospirillaceae bacterium]
MSIKKRSVAIVTGGSRGIGAATALTLAKAGTRVVLMARSAEGLSDTAKSIEIAGGNAQIIAADICNYDAAMSAVEMAMQAFGQLDILVNNAGVIAPIGAIGDTHPEEWSRCINVNLIGSYNMVRASLGVFLSQGSGVIVNISSGAARHALQGWSAYCCAKAGTAMLTQALHNEYEASGIRVFGVDPGVADTDMQATIRASGLNPVSQIPRHELPHPNRPAEAIAWLCHKAPLELAGQEVSVNDEKFKLQMGKII